MKSITVRINGVKYQLNHENCALFTFKEDKYNHIFFIRGEEDYLYIFGQNDIMMKLAETGLFAMHYFPHEPPEMDMDAFNEWQKGNKPEIDNNPLTEAEVEYYLKELQDGIDWGELS